MFTPLLDKLQQTDYHDQHHKDAFGHRLRQLRELARLSRRKLQQLSSVPDRTIVDLEHGRKINLDRKTLYLLARALQLDTSQEREFFGVAGLTPDVPLECPDFYDMIKRFYTEADYPAFILNGLFDVHSCNSYFLALLGPSLQMLNEQAYRGAGPNLLRALFDPIFNARTVWREGWRELALINVCTFRMASQVHLHEPRYAHLLRELRLLPDFAEMWAATASPTTACPIPPYISQVHSAFGPMRILHTEAATTDAIKPYLRACLYVPHDDDATQLLVRLRKQTNKYAIQFGSMEIARFTRIV